MPDGPKVISANAFYADIVSARAQRETVSQMWDRIRATLDSFNTPGEPPAYVFPSDILQQVNRLSANGREISQAARNLMSAPPDYSITGDMIGHPIYGRDQASFEAFNRWEAKAELIMQGPQGQYSQWVTVQYGAGDLPDTVGALADDLDLYAQDLAAGYEGEYQQVGGIQLNQV